MKPVVYGVEKWRKYTVIELFCQIKNVSHISYNLVFFFADLIYLPNKKIVNNVTKDDIYL